jgi:hypothetical protein
MSNNDRNMPSPKEQDMMRTVLDNITKPGSSLSGGVVPEPVKINDYGCEFGTKKPIPIVEVHISFSSIEK